MEPVTVAEVTGMLAVELLLMAAVNVGSGAAIAAEMSIMSRPGVAACPD